MVGFIVFAAPGTPRRAMPLVGGWGAGQTDFWGPYLKVALHQDEGNWKFEKQVTGRCAKINSNSCTH
jgi:hypothetical protein